MEKGAKHPRFESWDIPHPHPDKSELLMNKTKSVVSRVHHLFFKMPKTLSNSLLDKVDGGKRVPSGGAAASFVISQHNSMSNLLCTAAIFMKTTKSFVPLHGTANYCLKGYKSS